jgi:isoleucyl-tRNA synthetase
LPAILGVSQVTLEQAFADSADSTSGLQVRVEPAEGVKCERCWRYVPAVSPEGICDRCVEALDEPGPPTRLATAVGR